MKYEAIIFDLDGTLLDTLPDILSVLNRTLTRYGLPTVGEEQAKRYIGNGARELVRLAAGEKNQDRLEEILSYYKALYAQCKNDKTSLFEGEERVLLSLKERGVRSAVLTNKPHEVAKNTQARFFSRFGFVCVQGQEEGLPLKPAPDGALRILPRLGVKKEKCLFVGDGETDVLTARNAGLDCLSVLWGYRTREQLEEVGATAFVRSFDELEDFIISDKII